MVFARRDAGSVHAVRLGYDGRVAESVLVDAPAVAGVFHSPSMCFDDGRMGFPLVYGSTGIWATEPSFGVHFVHGAAAVANVGASCAGTTQSSNNGVPLPYVGSEFFELRLVGGRPNVATILVVGVAGANLPLPAAGPGCNLLVDPAQAMVVLPLGIADANGDASMPMPLPSLTRNADLHWQFVQFDGALLWSARGLRTAIR